VNQWRGRDFVFVQSLFVFVGQTLAAARMTERAKALERFIGAKRKVELAMSKVGLYRLNPVDPQLESAWFQPLNL
jgi:hypothetical protein